MAHTRRSWISKATCTYPHAHAHAPGYPHARTHRPISNTYCFSTAILIRERASVLRNTHIACVVVCKEKTAIIMLNIIRRYRQKFNDQVSRFVQPCCSGWAEVAQSVQRLATAWTVRRSNPCEGETSRTGQTDPGSHPASFPGVKRPGRGVNHPPHLAPRLRK